MTQTDRTTDAPEWVADFDLWTDPEHAVDPYPHYAELRDRCPVAHSDALGGYWLCTSYDDIHAVLSDAKTFSSRYITVPDHPEPAGPRIPLQLDPPDHGKYRLMLAPAFTPASAKALEPMARAITVELLEGMAARGGGEFVREFAAPLPQRLLLTWLGFPPEGVEYLARLDEESIRPTIATRQGESAERNAKELADRYFAEMVEERRATGPIGNDVLSYLVTATVDGRLLEMNELLRVLMLLYSAGLHTTTSTIGNMVAYLANRTDLRDRITADPSVIPRAIEELMRWESIVSVRRTPVRDVTVGGQTVRAGEPIVVFLGSAGRDESVFPDADHVDFERVGNRHMNFGVGPHRCLGSHLARMELRVSLEELHRVMPRYTIDPTKPFRRHTGVERGVDEMWLLAE